MSSGSIRRNSSTTDDQKKQPLGRVAKYTGVYLGIVKENKDAHLNGRLKVWIPEFSSRPEDDKGVFIASWVSPFAGATPSIDNNTDIEQMEGSQTAYGMWMQPPDVNNHVIITFLNGDPQWATVIGCLFQPYMNQMVPGFSAVDADKHHEGDTDPCPLPASEYNKKMSDTYSEGSTKRPVQHWAALGLRNSGLIEDDIRGTTTASARRESPSQVYGILTPGPKEFRGSAKKRKNDGDISARMGGHQFIMDDHADQEHIRLRTRSGAQILIDETNGLVRLNNRDGSGWVEIDEKGRISIYGADSASIRYEKDINIRADRDITMEAGRNISLKANRDYVENPEGSQIEGEMEGEGESGRVTIHANEDIHMIAHEELQAVTRTESMHFTSAEDFNATINNTASWATGDDYCTVVGNEMSTQVENGVDFIVNNGDYDLAVNGSYNHHASVDNSIFAGVDNIIQAVNDTEIFSYSGKADIGSQLNMTVKSYEGDVTVEAKKENVKLESNESANQITMRESGIATFSEAGTTNYSQTNVDFVVSPDLGVSSNPGDITYQGNPISGCLFEPELMNVRFDDASADFGVPEDIKFKIDTTSLDTSVNTINDSLEQIETRYNNAIGTLHSYVDDIIGVLSDIGNIPWTPDVPLPSFPSISFDLAVPALQLPDFGFSMCVDFSNLVNVDQFNPFPDGSFVNINTDLGGWTVRNIKSWVDTQKVSFDLVVQSFEEAPSSLDSTITQIKSNVDFIEYELDRLVDVNVTSNRAAFEQYQVGIGDLKTSVDQYNSTASGLSGVTTLGSFANDLGDHQRTLEQMNEKIQNDPNYDSDDLSDLQGTLDQWQDLSNNIAGYP